MNHFLKEGAFWSKSFSSNVRGKLVVFFGSFAGISIHLSKKICQSCLPSAFLNLFKSKTRKGLANSVDPDETARKKEPSHQGLRCLPFLYCHCTICLLAFNFIYATSLFEIMDSSKFKDEKIHFRK